MPRLILGLLLVFALCALALAVPIYIPFTPVTLERHNPFSNFAAFQDGLVRVPETLESQMLYSIQIQVGTPAETFKMVFDTTSPETIITGSNCKTSYCKRLPKLFNPDDSSTFQSLNSSIRGYTVGTDTITIGSVTVTSSTIGISNSASASENYPPINGVIGLSFSQFSRFNAPNFFDDLVSQGSIDRGMFSIYLDSKSDSNSSVLVFGGTDPSLYTGRITWRPVMSDRFWATRLVSITLDAARVHYCPEPCRVIFATGFNGIAGPPVYVRKINNALNISLNCDNYNDLPRLVFHLGPHYLSIPRSSYVSRDKGKCRSLLVESSFFKRNWILGNLFLRSYYTVFDADNRRIGWAPLPPTIISS